jgi:hypothetical protein
MKPIELTPKHRKKPKGPRLSNLKLDLEVTPKNRSRTKIIASKINNLDAKTPKSPYADGNLISNVGIKKHHKDTSLK